MQIAQQKSWLNCNTKTSFYMVLGMVLKCIKKVCEQSSSELIESKYISSLNPGSSVTFTQVYVKQEIGFVWVKN